VISLILCYTRMRKKKKEKKKEKRGSLQKIGDTARGTDHRTPNGVPSPAASSGAEGQRVGTPRRDVEKALGSDEQSARGRSRSVIRYAHIGRTQGNPLFLSHTPTVRGHDGKI